MSVVLGCHFGKRAVVLADTRVTWDGPGAAVLQDRLQKILPFAPKVAVGFAGDVAAAEAIIRAVRGRASKNERLKVLRKLASEFPRLAKHFYALHVSKHRRTGPVTLLLAGVETSGAVRMWVFESPNFHPSAIENGFGVFGSGAVVRPFLESNFAEIARISDAKAQTDKLVMGLEAELAQHGVKTVGGMLQVILLDGGGIRPYRYGYVDLDPESPASAKEMRMEKGVWIQTDLVRGQQVQVASPEQVLRTTPREERFHDYERVVKAPGKWTYLNYFVTCLSFRQPQIGSIEFDGLLTAVAGGRFPVTLPLLAPFSFRGFAGQHEVEIVLDMDGTRTPLYAETFTAGNPIDDVEGFPQIPIRVESPGIAFVDLMVNGQRLSRRPLLLSAIEGAPPEDPRKMTEFGRKQEEVLSRKQAQASDPVSERDGPLLEYFAIGHRTEIGDKSLKFEGLLHAAFWRTYPLKLRASFALGFRGAAGDHRVRIELVNAASRETTVLMEDDAPLSSSFLVKPVYGEFIIPIPKAGIYFVNLHVDGRHLGSTVLFADTDEPEYSYKLLDADTERVRQGELLILPKGTKEAPKNE